MSEPRTEPVPQNIVDQATPSQELKNHRQKLAELERRLTQVRDRMGRWINDSSPATNEELEVTFKSYIDNVCQIFGTSIIPESRPKLDIAIRICLNHAFVPDDQPDALMKRIQLGHLFDHLLLAFKLDNGLDSDYFIDRYLTTQFSESGIKKEQSRAYQAYFDGQCVRMITDSGLYTLGVMHFAPTDRGLDVVFNVDTYALRTANYEKKTLRYVPIYSNPKDREAFITQLIQRGFLLPDQIPLLEFDQTEP